MNLSILSLALAAPVLVAQAPSEGPSLADRLKTQGPEIEGLLSSAKPREALEKAQALLPQVIPAFDKANLNNARRSFLQNRLYCRAFDLAGRSAYAAGYWEKAHEYLKKSGEVAKSNLEEIKTVIAPQLNHWKAQRDKASGLLSANEAWIKELRAKKDPDESDKFNLDQIASIEKEFAEGDKWTKFFQGDLDTAEKDAAYYGPSAEAMEKELKDQEEQLAKYKFTNDKIKFVEGIMASPNYFDAFTPKQKVQYLYRLNVLSPDNKKVLKAIDVLQGKATPEPPAKKKTR